MKPTNLLLRTIALAVFAFFAMPPLEAIDAPVGKSVTFTVTSSGTPPFTYQWKKDGVVIPGAPTTSATYIIPSWSAANAGTYSVVVANAAGTAESNPVTLGTMQPPGNVSLGAVVATSASSSGTPSPGTVAAVTPKQ